MPGGVRYSGEAEYLGDEPLPEDEVVLGWWRPDAQVPYNEMGAEPRHVHDPRYIWDPWREEEGWRRQVTELDGKRLHHKEIEDLYAPSVTEDLQAPRQKEMEVHKDVKTLLKSIQRVEGVELRDNGRGHVGVYLKGQYVTSVSTTPSDYRWRDNVVADLRRAGITPATKPPKGVKDVELTITPMAVEDLRQRFQKMATIKGARAEFARFIVHDMPKLHPELRQQKSVASAEQTLSAMAKGSKPSDWIHELYSAAMREWDALQAQKERAAVAKAPEPPPVRDMTHVRKPEPAKEPEKKEETPVAEQKEPEAKEPEAETNGAPVVDTTRNAYLGTLLDILAKDGSNVSDKILERLDKLAGI